MSEDLVTVATYLILPEAEASKLRLEAEGLTVFLADTEIVNMDWGAGIAVGYIKLQVPTSQTDVATAMLSQIQSERQSRLEQAEESDTSKCLACGAAMAEEESACSACGWSYKGNSNG